MAVLLELTDVFLKCLLLRCRQCPVKESFADVIDCLFGGMAHIFRIEAIVPEFVHHYFVSWEIVGNIEWSHTEVGWKFCHQFFDSQEKRGFADLVFVSSVLEMAYRADSEYELFSYTSLCTVAKINDPVKCSDDFLAGETHTEEVCSWLFEAVGYNPVGCSVSEAPACSESYDDLVAFKKPFSGAFQRCIGLDEEVFNGVSGECGVVAE